MARKTREEALETRNLILDTAEAVFSERGVSRTSLNEIAKSAGLTRGAIYWHFKNKADLFEAMMQRVFLPMEEFAQESAQATEANPLDRIRNTALQVVDMMVNEERARRVFEIVMHKMELVDDMLPMRDRHLHGRNECIGKVESDFQVALSRNLLKSHVKPHEAAIGLHAILDGLIANWVLEPSAFDLEAQARFTIDAFLAGLTAQP
ncbi:TetR family transcriptional regulator [Limnobacter sp.]|uniref:TetR family transcriptional regulator n=1 Tax=Limnobacter sp. TaxID=2003368 RepID=UPI002587E4D1|nr:TetR family transcriptional regulator [Limnobacter sp.]